MPVIECPQCGEDSDLTGRTVGDTIEITCNRCGHSWPRDTEPSCPKCGGREVHPVKEPLIQKARGTAYSIVGQRTVYLCVDCDVAEIERRNPKEERAPREDPWA